MSAIINRLNLQVWTVDSSSDWRRLLAPKSSNGPAGWDHVPAVVVWAQTTTYIPVDPATTGRTVSPSQDGSVTLTLVEWVRLGGVTSRPA